MAGLSSDVLSICNNVNEIGFDAMEANGETITAIIVYP